jgi:hypothetical protein
MGISTVATSFSFSTVQHPVIRNSLQLSTACDLNIINNVKLRVPNLSSYKTQHKSKLDKQFEKSEKRQDTFKNSQDLD